MSTREQGRHNRTLGYCDQCKRPVRSLPRHNRRVHQQIATRLRRTKNEEDKNRRYGR